MYMFFPSAMHIAHKNHGLWFEIKLLKGKDNRENDTSCVSR